MKKVIGMILSVVLLLSMSVTAFAAEPTIEDQINALSDEYGFETFDMDTQKVQTVLEFDSIEEFEEFIRAVEQPQTFDVAIDTSKMPQTRDLNDNYVISWWSPFTGWGMTGIACWRNIAFDYSYKFVNGAPQFTNVSNIDSYLTGINITFWDQKAASYNIVTEETTKDKVEINVKGNYVLGVALEGFNIGLTIPGEWDGSLRIY